MSETITVVGGGVAGLVVARSLARGGADVVLHEATDRLGGTVGFHTVAGLVLDAGAESFAARKGTVETLATTLGLGPEVVPPSPSPAWLYRPEGAVPLPATSILGIPAVPVARDVVAVVGWPAALRALLDSLIPGPFGANATSLGALVRTRMGRGMLERLVAPVALGVHSTHPDELAVDRVAPGLADAMKRDGSLALAVRDLRDRAPAGSAVLGIRGGVHRLVDELAADCRVFGVDVRLNSPVAFSEALRANPDDTVLAAAPSLEGGTRVVLVTLVLDAPELDANPRGTGLLVVPGTPGVTAKALTHSTAKWSWLRDRAEGKHVVRLSYAGPVDVEVARVDAATLLGVDLPPSAVLGADVVEWMRPVPSRLSGEESLWRVGESVSGTGLANVVAQATQVAEAILAR